MFKYFALLISPVYSQFNNIYFGANFIMILKKLHITMIFIIYHMK